MTGEAKETKAGVVMTWEQIRAAYPMQELLNLNNAAVSPTPMVVQEATLDALRFITHNPDFNMWSKLDAALPGTKLALAELADCSPDEIALNRNSSEGLSTAIFGIDLDEGDEVIVSGWDYPSARLGWIQRQRREGIAVVPCHFGLFDSDDNVVNAYLAAMTPRTRVLHLTHMLHWNGRVLPVEQLCKIARDRRIITLVDGAQTFAQMPLSIRALGCDYFVSSLHKWLGAPIGNGMLFISERYIANTWPLLASFEEAQSAVDKFDHWNLGTYNSALQAAVPQAIVLHKQIGVSRIHARLRELTRYWVTRACDIPGFTLHTDIDREDVGAISLFSIEGVDARALEGILRQSYRIHTKFRQVQKIAGIRVSPHIYTTEDDLDRFVLALRTAVRSL